jgi:hypothetical protein
LEKVIRYGRESTNPIADYWHMRHIYRSKFKLTAAEMDAEPLKEVQYHFAMWRLEAKRQREEDKAMERKAKSNPHG